MNQTEENLRRIRAYNKRICDDAEFEKDHPRNENGEFTSGGGASKAPKTPLQKLAEATEPKYLGFFDPNGNPVKSPFQTSAAANVVTDAELEKKLGSIKTSNEALRVLNELNIVHTDAIRNTILPKDLESAKACVRGFHRILSEFPEADVCFGGLIRATNEELQGNAAGYMGAFGNNVIKFNEDVFEQLGELEAERMAGVESGFYPEGTDASAAIVHELSHALVQHLRTSWSNQKNVDFCDYIFYDVCGFTSETTAKEIKEKLCEYATKNHEDFVCEALSEALTSKTPRPVSLKVYKAVKDELQKLRGEGL